MFSKKDFSLYKLYNYHYTQQQKPPGHEFTLGAGSSLILKLHLYVNQRMLGHRIEDKQFAVFNELKLYLWG